MTAHEHGGAVLADAQSGPEGDPVCDLCGTMWSAGYTEQWPAETRGPHRPDRLYLGRFGVCRSCLHLVFGPARQPVAAGEVRLHREQRQFRQAAHQRGQVLALDEAVVRDAELGDAT